jgi:type 2 lantibiotic biosynthesis protein LanM
MEAYSERSIERAATIDELLSDDFEALPGRKGDTELAARRLAAWCRSCANGDWALFGRRLERDGLSFAQVLARFATVRRKVSAPPPEWIDDATWIETALRGVIHEAQAGRAGAEPFAFEHLLLPAVEHADSLLWADLGVAAADNFAESARASLRRMLLNGLTDLCAAPLYERFARARAGEKNASDVLLPDRNSGTSRYQRFVADMKAGGFRSLFEEKPVLLRLIATLTRQWIDSSREFASRLDADLETLRRDFLQSETDARVARIDGGVSDRHNGGRSVLIVTFEDGARIVYKPKDLRLDVAWHDLIARLNGSAPPLELRAVRAIARKNYGWTEFIDHTGCADPTGPERFFRRAGAWLALFHCFVATDMHQENIIAAGDHPVPIDLETILQTSAAGPKAQDGEGAALDAAADLIANSVMRVGLLPAYGRSPDNSVFAMGGLTSDWNTKIQLAWTDINTDEMRPAKKKLVGNTNPNLPHVGGRYAKFGEHFDAFISGFEDYANFLADRTRATDQWDLFAGFAGVPVRKVVRPTRFYSMLLQRLKNHRIMEDGAVWSAEADFIARLSDWEASADASWPFHRAERAALVTLNVPHFVLPSDGDEIRDMTGMGARSASPSGLDRARARMRSFDAKEIAWQSEVIRANAEPPKPAGTAKAQEFAALTDLSAATIGGIFVSEADRFAADLAARAIRREGGAAWIGLDWLGDAEVYQLVCLGPDLYNGVSGIGVFLAAHAQVTGHAPSADLALAGVAHLRNRLKNRNSARFARSLGIGGAAGLGSLVYALSVMSKSLRDDKLLADAYVASQLMTDDLIAGDKRLDVIGGSAGAILSLLRLYRDTRADDVLIRAVRCGEHLMRQDRFGPKGSRSWVGQGFGTQGLNGMSHGAAGFAYALASLAFETGREEFELAASECIAFENSSYDADRQNWPDRRIEGQPGWPCQWCHGAPGIGLARAGLLKRGVMDVALLQSDIRNALAGTEQGWRGKVDTLCCGAIGSVEFFCEAGEALERLDVREIAAQRLASVVQAASVAGDYRWNSGKQQFNLGLFRGIAGVGYTLLRRVDNRLPNILTWE